jgi:hypothetical protein
MSNKVTIQTVEFKKVPSGEVTKGFCISDNYGNAYGNTWGSIPEDDMEILKKVLADHFYNSGSLLATDNIGEMLDYVDINESGVEINGEWYDWEQIGELFYPPSA